MDSQRNLKGTQGETEKVGEVMKKESLRKQLKSHPVSRCVEWTCCSDRLCQKRLKQTPQFCVYSGCCPMIQQYFHSVESCFSSPGFLTFPV